MPTKKKAAPVKASSGRVIKVDFTGVETGGGRPRIPAGDYGFRIKAVKTGKSDNGPYLNFHMLAIQGDKRGLKKVIQHTCSLLKQSLWNLRQVLEACGKQVPSSIVNIPLDKLVGLELAGTVMDDEPYQGRIKSIITAFFPLSDLGNTSDTGDELEEAGELDDAEESGEMEEEVEEEASDAEELFS